MLVDNARPFSPPGIVTPIMPTRRELANALRALAMDAVQAANSGHPGAPMGMADIAEVLWRDVLKHNPGNPRWVDRDRFVLSNGHASMLLYALLHLTGYPLGLDEIRKFRQLGARTAGHPEHHPDIGIETTTGPLGQGFANAVGMALAERTLAAEFNRDGHEIIDHHTYVFLGDGCLMEGISHEAASFAGTQKLGKLIAVFDDNGISIDGKVRGWCTDDVAKRFSAYGWHVIKDVDGHDAGAVASALRKARAHKREPSIILARTIIGFGAPGKQGTSAVHGEALGEGEVAAAREALGWPYPPFEVPQEIRAEWDARAKGAAAEKAWQRRYRRYQKAFPELAAEFERRMAGRLPANFDALAAAALAGAQATGVPQATRASSGAVLNAIGPGLPELIGGAADLTGSVNTLRKDSRTLGADEPGGNYIHYGVREFGMTAVMNGMVLHGGLRPYGGTFLVFSDYARNAVRLAALMQVPVILVYTHDSIGLGEDGPTHQPVEHLESLRAMPGLTLWRPADAVETAIAWRAALEHGGPTALVLTRQALAQQQRTPEQLAAIARGGYTLIDCEGVPEAIVIATGSEVGIAAEAVRALAAKGRRVRLVSMPSVERFEAQDAEWREAVLPRAVRRRVAVEAGARQGWWQHVGLDGEVIGMRTFGASGKGAALMAHFGFTAGHIETAVERLFG
ncbi:MAG: Transketolase 1 [Steroidobacteraceae bacterium]|nr:Transketolase 1 [Steroidobacteraceae bacterium]